MCLSFCWQTLPLLRLRRLLLLKTSSLSHGECVCVCVQHCQQFKHWHLIMLSVQNGDISLVFNLKGLLTQNPKWKYCHHFHQTHITFSSMEHKRFFKLLFSRQMASFNMQSTNEIYAHKAFSCVLLWYFGDFCPFFFFILIAHVLSLYVKDQHQPMEACLRRWIKK